MSVGGFLLPFHRTQPEQTQLASQGKPPRHLGLILLRPLGSHSVSGPACGLPPHSGSSPSLDPQGPGAEVTPTQPATAACQPHTNRCLGATARDPDSFRGESDLP